MIALGCHRVTSRKAAPLFSNLTRINYYRQQSVRCNIMRMKGVFQLRVYRSFTARTLSETM